MKRHEEVFLSLVRNSLWDTQVEVPVDFNDWSLIMRLAEAQAMQGSVAKAILDSPAVLSKMKPGTQSKLSNMLMTNVVMHSMANSSIQKLVKALRDVGIECVLLKGQGLAANYKYPDTRECGDIDLYVGIDNYRQSYEVLKDIVDEIDDHTALDKGGKHYHAILSGISIEVHKYSEVLPSPSLDRIYQRHASEGLSQNLVEMPFGEIMVSSPANNFNAFFIFCHLWNHFISVGVGIRQICDWTMFLHRRGANIDTEYLSRILNELKLMTPWKTFGCIAVDVLGLSAEEFPFYDAKYRTKALKVLDRIMTEGDMGRETEFIRVADRGYLYEKLFSLKYYLKRFIGMVSLFPCHAIQQLRYSIISGFKRLF